MIQAVTDAYGFDKDQVKLEPFGTGLINNTWKLTAAGKPYILQRINQAVFKHPRDIANNMSRAAAYLKLHHPAYPFVAPVASINGDELVYIEAEGYFRLFPFVPGSHSKDVVATASQAFEAATQFGRFTKLLARINLQEFKITIPGFHDLRLRYRQFTTALEKGNPQRIRQSRELIQQVQDQHHLVTEYKRIMLDPAFKLRVTHHDTKISNVLFDATDRGLCVIDLDTVMPGHFISDLGDMMRTYLSPVDEDEKDFTKIEIRDDFYKAIVKGYFGEMKDELTAIEKEHFFYAGKFMTYMQALRFITDYINNDVYYGAKYEAHNLVRAGNQMVLLQRLVEKEPVLNAFGF